MSEHSSSSGVERYLAASPLDYALDPAFLKQCYAETVGTSDPTEVLLAGEMKLELHKLKVEEAVAAGRSDVSLTAEALPAKDCFTAVQKMKNAPPMVKILA